MPKSVPLWWSNPSAILRYTVSVLSVAAAVVAGLLLDTQLNSAPFVSLFVCAIMFATWFGGVRPGLLATALSILAFDYYFVPPTHSLLVDGEEALRLVLFAITALFVFSFVAAQKSAADSLRRTRDDLRTAVHDLERINKALQAENAERKRAEQQVRQAERELQVTFDTIPVLAGSYQHDGSPDFVNRAWRDYTGLSVKELKDRRWETVIHPDDVARVESERRAHLATGMPFQTEQRLRSADGEYRWHFFSRVPLRDEDGNVVKWYGTGYDIEDRKRAEDALRRSKAQLTHAQSLSKTGSVGFKVATGEIVWSDEAARIYGYESDTKPSVELVLQRVHPDDIAIVQREIDRARQGEQEFDFELRLMMPDGTIKYVYALAHLLKDGGSDEIVGALMDITAAKQAQDALSKAQAELAHVTRVTSLGELAASIAHEVNQPLSAIVTNGAAGLRWLDRESPLLDEVRSSLESIIGDAKRASEVIHKIRSFSKKTNPEMTQLHINDVVDEAVSLIKREAFDHRVTMRLQLASGLPSVRGDRIQLQQVIFNLAINGVQAMTMVADRPRVLFIRTQLLEPDQVLVAVEDGGVGIEPENLNRLFSAFYTTKPNGLGMGLSICRSIIEAHGGRVWASRNSDRGMIFQFTISARGPDG
jgi:PAS domain S-box-containing protein